MTQCGGCTRETAWASWKDGVFINLSPNSSDTYKKKILLQRLDKKFGYTDVTEVSEITSGDRLTFREQAKSPTMSAGTSSGSAMVSIMS